jgi:hypothetical protein
MSLGSLWLRFRQKFGHGVRVAWYRDRIRPMILQTDPVIAENPQCEIHVLTSTDDWLNLIWAMKSFYSVSQNAYRLCIHDDGSLTDEAVRTLMHHFPAARLLARTAADAMATQQLADYPNCARFRSSNHLSLKLLDSAMFLDGSRMLLMDSDVLFFRTPTALIGRIESQAYNRNCFNADFASAYTVNEDDAKKLFDIELMPCVNSGLGLLNADSLRLDWIEEFLCCDKLRSGHFWLIEQTLFALLSSRFGVELLPKEYTLSLEKNAHRNRPFRHYVGRIRHLMYSEGIADLTSQGFLRMNSGKHSV